MKFFNNNDTISAIEAQYNAQKIAFAPIIFQVARSMRDLGVLEILYNNKGGLSVDELANKANLSTYSINVMLETGLSADIVKLENDKFFITKTGYFLLHDKMTNINMNYNHYVNYKGLYDLDIALQEQKASGLKVFGDDDTIYPMLSTLPEKVKESWFSFDHFYSDGAFDDAINLLLELKPSTFLDIGGNTGKFAISLCQKDLNVTVTIMDLPQQIELAKVNIAQNNLEKRVDFVKTNILKDDITLTAKFDVIWMSQFLDCFSEEQIVNILIKVKGLLDVNGRMCIMEPFWDRQNFETSAFCIINTSPYFTAMANGYSKMYHSEEFKKIVFNAGLELEQISDNVGLCQSILILKNKQ